MKKFQQYVDETVDDAIACAKRIEEEGGSRAEESYRAIVALLIRDILLRVESLRCQTAAIACILAGLLLCKLIRFFL